jgi:hypothetical protein
MLGKGLVTQRIEASCSDIFLELPVPQLSIELDEPTAERRKLLAIKLRDGSFDLLDLAHDEKPTIHAQRSGKLPNGH